MVVKGKRKCNNAYQPGNAFRVEKRNRNRVEVIIMGASSNKKDAGATSGGANDKKR